MLLPAFPQLQRIVYIFVTIDKTVAVLHEIEPFYNWRHLYQSEEDEYSPFYGREYSEFEFSNTIYNYYIHPQWDEFGSRTLYLKILFVDYEQQTAIIELIGEWNDAVENDIMQLKRSVIDPLLSKQVYKYILIAENVLNFHSSDTEYYEEWQEELSEDAGWIAILNAPQQTGAEMKAGKLGHYLHFFEQLNWRVYTPEHLLHLVEQKLLLLP